MTPYLQLLRHVLAQGRATPTRATLASTGSKVTALSVFGVQARYDLSAGFPIVTTKRVPFRQVAVELLWFLSGSTNVGYLREYSVHIWDQWADDDGSIGMGYGKQWRDFGGVDQIANLIRRIPAVAANPEHNWARRLVLTAWNPPEIRSMRLPPCHMTSVFRVSDGKLSCMLWQRSGDVFLGVPWNVSSYALLTHMLARSAGLGVDELVHSIADAHLYTNHIDQAREQLAREPLPPPTLHWAADAPMDPLSIRPEHVRLKGYNCHPGIRGEVAI